MTISVESRGPWLEKLPLRMLGENVTFTRAQWSELLEDLREESELARRVRKMLDLTAEEWSVTIGTPTDSAIERYPTREQAMERAAVLAGVKL